MRKTAQILRPSRETAFHVGFKALSENMSYLDTSHEPVRRTRPRCMSQGATYYLQFVLDQDANDEHREHIVRQHIKLTSERDRNLEVADNGARAR